MVLQARLEPATSADSIGWMDGYRQISVDGYRQKVVTVAGGIQERMQYDVL
jgi:hypothetical protein